MVDERNMVRTSRPLCGQEACSEDRSPQEDMRILERWSKVVKMCKNRPKTTLCMSPCDRQ